MGTADEDSSADQGDDFTPRIGNDYQAVIPPLREGTVISSEEAEDTLPPCSIIEKYTFILALYIFGKDLSLVSRFVGSKNKKEIQALYYGQFYASYEYRRWSEWGKWRGRRCVYGEKLFTECRMKELLSRLLPCISERCQDVLMETSRNFLEGKVSFEDYIFKLKDSVGILLLNEAVGIGKEGTEDLTSTAFEPLSSGKDQSSVTPEDVLKFLTSFKKLRKARINARWEDFFWDAVWPRLLARGWQSQQPKGRRMRRSLNTSLIFLVPSSSETCTNKFSWRLLKGTHYHVAIKNLLKTVSSDPSVLALGDEEAADLNLMEERRFLEPFPIFDASTLHVTEQNEVTELRSLAVQPALRASSPTPPIDLLSATKEDGNASLDIGMYLNSTDPGSNQEESSCRTENISEVDELIEFQCQSKLPNQREGLEIQVHPQNSTSTIYFEKGGSSSNVVEGCVTENFFHREPTAGTGEARIYIDLKFPCVPLHVETDQSIIFGTMQNMNDSSADKSSTQEKVDEVEISEVGSEEEQQAVASSQRKSIRSRPLTKKAWEALENDFYSIKRKRRG